MQITTTEDGYTIISTFLSEDSAFLSITPAMKCGGCNVMHCHMINRFGSTHCAECDEKKVAEASGLKKRLSVRTS